MHTVVRCGLIRKRTTGQSNLTTGRIAAAHGRCNRIHQVAPMFTHLVRGSPGPQECAPRWHLDRFGHFVKTFVKRFALCYQTVVCLSVLSYLSVTLVHCGQMVG